MTTSLTGTIAPWVLGTLLILSLMAFAVAIKSWRDMKRSPYFFMRRQAEKRLQSYLTASLFFFLASLGVFLYGWQAPVDDTPRVAVLAYAKPPAEEIVALVESIAIVEPITVESLQEVGSIAVAAEAVVPDTAVLRASSLFEVTTLPEEYDQFEPTVDLQPNTDMGALRFSTDIDGNFEAINPRQIFAEGSYTLYATFTYEAMADGMEWSWVWRRDGQVVGGGNEIWQYGPDGPGYIYFNPEEGFSAGEYSLEVWVNGEMQSYASATMNTAAASAGN